MYSFVTTHGHGHVFVDGIQASSFGMHHGAPNAFYTAHRVAFAMLQTIGTSRDTIHKILSNQSLVAANRLIGDMAVAFAKFLNII